MKGLGHWCGKSVSIWMHLLKNTLGGRGLVSPDILDAWHSLKFKSFLFEQAQDIFKTFSSFLLMSIFFFKKGLGWGEWDRVFFGLRNVLNDLLCSRLLKKWKKGTKGKKWSNLSFIYIKQKSVSVCLLGAILLPSYWMDPDQTWHGHPPGPRECPPHTFLGAPPPGSIILEKLKIWNLSLMLWIK